METVLNTRCFLSNVCKHLRFMLVIQWWTKTLQTITQTIIFNFLYLWRPKKACKVPAVAFCFIWDRRTTGSGSSHVTSFSSIWPSLAFSDKLLFMSCYDLSISLDSTKTIEKWQKQLKHVSKCCLRQKHVKHWERSVRKADKNQITCWFRSSTLSLSDLAPFLGSQIGQVRARIETQSVAHNHHH